MNRHSNLSGENLYLRAELRLRNRKKQSKLYEMLFNLTGGKDYCFNNYLASVPQRTNVEKHKPKKSTNMHYKKHGSGERNFRWMWQCP